MWRSQAQNFTTMNGKTGKSCSKRCSKCKTQLLQQTYERHECNECRACNLGVLGRSGCDCKWFTITETKVSCPSCDTCPTHDKSPQWVESTKEFVCPICQDEILKENKRKEEEEMRRREVRQRELMAERAAEEKQRFTEKWKEDPLSCYGVKKLRILAKNKRLVGRWNMSKDELITQLRPMLEPGDLPIREYAVNTPTLPREMNIQEEYQLNDSSDDEEAESFQDEEEDSSEEEDSNTEVESIQDEDEDNNEDENGSTEDFKNEDEDNSEDEDGSTEIEHFRNEDEDNNEDENGSTEDFKNEDEDNSEDEDGSTEVENIQNEDEESSEGEDVAIEVESVVDRVVTTKGKRKANGRRMISHHQSDDGAPASKKRQVNSKSLRPESNLSSRSSSTENLIGNKESDPLFCVIDIETTSLITPDLTQISGQTLDGEHNFNVYILPNKPIDFQASKITGIKKVNNQLVVRGKIVKTFFIDQALMMFADWLDSLSADIILVGHNVVKFDAAHLSRHAREQNLTSLFHRVVGTLDTALLFANLHPSARPHTLAKMYKMFFGTNFEGAHGAVEDCRAVARILNEGNISDIKKKQFVKGYSF